MPLLQLLKLVRKSSHFFEPVAQSAGGAASATDWNHDENNVPTQSAAALGDSNSGMHLAIGILAALLQREHTGEDTFVYQSMQDAVLNLCRIKLRDQIMLDNLGALPHYAVYPNWKWGKAIPRAENTEGGQVIGWTYKAKGWETNPNAYVYKEILASLGYDPDQIEKLTEEGVISKAQGPKNPRTEIIKGE